MKNGAKISDIDFFFDGIKGNFSDAGEKIWVYQHNGAMEFPSSRVKINFHQRKFGIFSSLFSEFLRAPQEASKDDSAVIAIYEGRLKTLIDDLNLWAKSIPHTFILTINTDIFNANSANDIDSIDSFLIFLASIGLFPKVDGILLSNEFGDDSQYLFLHLEMRPYTARLPRMGDVETLVSLEEKCWPGRLKMSKRTIETRVKRFNSGQLVVEEGGKLLGVIYTQRIISTEGIFNSTGHTVDKIHDKSGRIAQLLAVNIEPTEQDRFIGDQLLELCLQRCELDESVDKVVGVTRCKDYKKYEDDISYLDYIFERNEAGKLIDTVLRFHESHGGKVARLVEKYRPFDAKNKKHGVLIEYDIYQRYVHKQHLSATESGKTEILPPIDEMLSKAVVDRTGVSVSQRELFESPLMDLGLDSGDLLDLTDLLATTYSVELHSTFFFENNTLNAVKGALTKLLAGKRKTLKDLESSLNKLSEDGHLQSHRSEGTSNFANEPIAVVGLSCRLPGGIENLEDLWSVLVDGKNTISTLPQDRWVWEADVDPSKKDKGIDRGGFLDDIASFDAGFFRLSPAEAKLMDPQQRLLLQLVWSCIEDAGYRASDLSDVPVGVYVGASGSDYQSLYRKGNDDVDAHAGLATSLAVLANRISYFFNFSGPSLQIDTACSSSLVAVSEAVNAIRLGKCEQAIVAGVNIMCYPATTLSYYKSGMLSVDGLCKSFDDDANGYVRSEGCITTLLKPYSKAVEDGDEIYGVIRGTAVNHCGHSGGITVPNPRRQAELIQKAWQDGGVTADSISYMEAHCTGTPLGDPIEVQGIKSAFENNLKGDYREGNLGCGLGSIKSNLGHLEAASGLAGMLKVLAAMRHEEIPKNATLNKINSKIELDKSPFYVLQENHDWTVPVGETRRAGVSSFGFGGANAHIVMESVKTNRLEHEFTEKKSGYLIPISAKSKASLRLFAEGLLSYLDESNPLPALSGIEYTLKYCRESFRYRAVAYVESYDSLKRFLSQLTESERLFDSDRDAFDEESILEAMSCWGQTGVTVQSGVVDEISSWLKGVEFNKKSIPKEFVRLPTYHFNQKSYWVEQKESNEPRSQNLQKQLVGGFTVEEMLGGKRYRCKIPLSSDCVQDHVVGGVKIFPGVGYLYLVHQVINTFINPGALRSNHSVFRKTKFHSPLKFSKYDEYVLIEIEEARGSESAFRIYSDIEKTNVNPDQGSKRLLCSGVFSIESLIDFIVPSPKIDNGVYQDRSEIYKKFERIGFEYGKGHQVLKNESKSRQGNLVCQVGADGNGEAIGLLDGLLQAGLLSLDGMQEHGHTYVPYALEYAAIGGDIGRSSHFIQSESGVVDKENRSANVNEIVLVDTSSTSTVVFRGVNYREYKRDQSIERKTDQYHFMSDKDHVLEKVWHDKSEKNGPDGDLPDLIIACGIDEKYLRNLDVENIVSLKCGESELAVAFKEYAAQLLSILRVFSEGLGRGTSRKIQFFYSLEGAFVSCHGLFGMCKSFALENGNISVQSIGFDNDSLRSGSFSDFYRCVGEDVETRFIQSNHRVASYQPMSSPQADQWRSGKTYLITGGAGGLGFKIAKFLLEKDVRTNIVLVGRRPERDVALKDHFTSNDLKRVTYFSADVTQRESLAKAFERGNSQFGRVDVVIHAAGILRDSLIRSKAERDLREVLDVKVSGAINIATLLKDDDDCKVIFFSSTSGVFGNYGQADYAAANGFLDEYAQYLSASEPNKYLSIAWPLWADGGMQVGTTITTRFKEKFGFLALPTDVGFEVFDKLVGTDISHSLVVFGDAKEIDNKCGTEILTKEDNGLTDIQINDLVEPSGRISSSKELIEQLKQVVSLVSGVEVDDIDADVSLSDYGFDSIMYSSLTKKINDEMGYELSESIFYEYDTISALSPLFKGSSPEDNSQNLNRLDAISYQGLKNKISPEGGNHASIVKQLVKSVAVVTLMDEHDVERDTDWPEFGLDSISLGTLSEYLSNSFGYAISTESFYEFSNIDALAAQLGTQTRTQVAPEPIDLKHLDESSKLANATPKVQASSQSKKRVSLSDAISDDIAIVGLSIDFAQSPDLGKFWDNLLNQNNCVEELGDKRWLDSSNRSTNRFSGLIDDTCNFDEKFFGVSPTEALIMDPQQRLMLTHTWKVFEDAGYAPSEFDGASAGVFIGTIQSGYSERLYQTGVEVEAYTAPSFVSAVGANRVSHFFNLQGPSEIVDTACSSALVAIGKAAEAIKSGRCDTAIAGAVNTLVSPALQMSFEKSGALTTTNSCMPFSENSDGYARSEGVGLVLLKPLNQAIRDKDNIYAVVKGYADHHGGKSNSILAPNPKAQLETITRAYRAAGIAPEDVDYIETHGVGLNLLDGVEADTLDKLFVDNDKTGVRVNPVYIGSNKGNFGHTEYASGMASLAKVLLQMRHKKIAPTIGDGEYIKNLKHEGSTLKVADTVVVWEKPLDATKKTKPRRAGVSAFGFSGVYAHLVLEEYPRDKVVSGGARVIDFPFAVTGKSKSSLIKNIHCLIRFLESEQVSDVDLASMSYTLMVGREALTYRIAFVANNIDQVIDQLRQELEGVSSGTKTVVSVVPGRLEKLLNRDNNFHHLLRSWFVDGKLSNVMEAWSKGIKVDWSEYYGSIDSVARLHLPTYQFDSTRYWFDHDFKENIPVNGSDDISIKKAEKSVNEQTLYSLVEKVSGLPGQSLSDDATLESISINSLKGLELKHEIQREFGVDVSLDKFFSPEYTVGELYRDVDEKAGSVDSDRRIQNDDKVPLSETLPLTAMQEAFVFGRAHGAHVDSVGAHIFLEADLVEGVDLTRLKLAWRKVVQRQAALRIRVVDNDRQQIEAEGKKCDLKIMDMSGLPFERYQSRLKALKESLECKVYQSDDWPFFEVYTVKYDDKCTVLLSIDEIISDALSVNIILSDWTEGYCHESSLTPLKTNFWDFVAKGEKAQGSVKWEQSRDYWLSKGPVVISGPALPKNTHIDPDSSERFKRKRLSYHVFDQDYTKIKYLAKEMSVSPTVLFLSLFSFVLNKFSGSGIFSLLTTTMKRSSSESDVYKVVGPMINTVLFESQTHTGNDLSTLSDSTKRSLIRSIEHSDVCSSEIIREISRENRNAGATKIEVVFTSLLGFDGLDSAQNDPIFKRYSLVNQTPQIYLDHQLSAVDDGALLTWDVADFYYQDGLISEMFDCYIGLIDRVLNHKGRSIDLSMMAQENVRFDLTDQQLAYAALRQNRASEKLGGCQVYLALEIRGFDRDKFERACASLIRRHPILKSVFTSNGEQYISPAIDRIPIEYGRSYRKEELVYQFIPLDQGPYINIFVSESEESTIVHLCIDMMLADYPSSAIIAKDLIEFYQRENDVYENTSLYFDYVNEKSRLITRDGEKHAKSYWASKFDSVPSGPSLTEIRGKNKPTEKEVMDLVGVVGEYEQLNAICDSHGVTVVEVLLAAYMEVIYVVNMKQPFTLAVPCWDRFELVNDVSTMVGDFTTMCWVEYRHNVGNFIDRVMDVKRQIKLDKEQWPISGLATLRRLRQGKSKTFSVVFTDGIPKMDVISDSVEVKEVSSRTTGVEIDNVSFLKNNALHCAWHLAPNSFDLSKTSEAFYAYLNFIRGLTQSKKMWLETAEFDGLEDMLSGVNIRKRNIHGIA
ncbi:MAG: SDR family NAD(P)-dependent oxidoreductase [Agarilytica sp.]